MERISLTEFFPPQIDENPRKLKNVGRKKVRATKHKVYNLTVGRYDMSKPTYPQKPFNREWMKRAEKWLERNENYGNRQKTDKVNNN